MLSGFSRKYGYRRYWILPREAPYYQGRLSSRICLGQSTPTPFNGLFRQSAAVSLLRLHVAPIGSHGILTVSAIAIAIRLRLDRKSTRLNSSHANISYAVFCLKKKKKLSQNVLYYL